METENKNQKNKYFESILVIGLSLLFTFGVLFGIQKIMVKDVANIADNNADEYFYEGKYDQAIAAYDKLQEKEEWPIYKVKEAEIYSIKGDINASNNLLKEAVVEKDKLMATNSEKYLEDEKEFMNEVVFTFFMNGEYSEAISLGEYYLESFDTYKPLLRTMFTVYLEAGENEKAKDIVDKYPVDETSSYDLAVLAKMQMTDGYYTEGLENLSKAYKLNNNEIKVFDVITQEARYNKENLLYTLNTLIEENDDISYELFMAKVYSVDESTKDLAKEIMGNLDENVDNINASLINISIDNNYYNESEWNEMINNLVDSEENAYIGYYLKAWTYFNSGEYEEALEASKQSVLSNEEYEKNYGVLIPKIMYALGKIENADGYFRKSLYEEPFNYNNMIDIGNYYVENAADYIKAEQYYNLALKLNPNESEIYYDLAKVKLQCEDYEGAIEELNKAIEIDSNNGSYYRALGTAYFNLGDNENAIYNIKEAYAINEEDVLSLNNAGCYYMLIDNDIWRGYENIEHAYENMSDNLDENSKALITENYKKTKEVYDKFVEDEIIPAIMPELELSY